MSMVHLPFDCTTLVRKTLPLPVVRFDTGAVTRAELRDMGLYAHHLAVWSPKHPLAEVAHDVVALTIWALEGYCPVYHKGKLL